MIKILLLHRWDLMICVGSRFTERKNGIVLTKENGVKEKFLLVWVKSGTTVVDDHRFR